MENTKQKLIEKLSMVSDEDFKKAIDRWVGGGMNGVAMAENFISILEEYIFED